MTKTEKKELFLLMMESWFAENCEVINFDNCVGFYNYLIDCLEFEAQFSPDYEVEFNAFLIDFIDLLCNFDKYSNIIVLDRGGLKKTIFNHCEKISPKNINIFSEKIIELFTMVKNEYFL